ncbi:protein arginine N-methyltransferase 9-like [Aphomia sociella]
MEGASEAVNAARQSAFNNDFQESFMQYVNLLKEYPALKCELEAEFITLIVLCSEKLIDRTKLDMFSNFKIALEMYPDNPYALNVMGKYLCKYGHKYEGLQLLEQANKSNPSIVCVEKNLNNAKRSLFLPDIFGIINDKRKNEAYRKAIKATIDPDFDCVIETNSGSGVLLLYISECYPQSHILGDDLAVKQEWMKYMLHANDEPIVFNSPLMVKQNHVMGKGVAGMHNLWITDMFVTTLFDDYLISTLSEALKAPIAKSVRVLPKKAEYFVMGVKSNQLMRKCHLRDIVQEWLHSPTFYVSLSTNITGTKYEDDITTYDDLEYVTEPVLLLTIDFNDHHALADILNSRIININIKARKNTKISTLVGWFNLYLTDDVMITTDPRSEERVDSWKQAVFYDFRPKNVMCDNEIIEANFKLYDGELFFIPEDEFAISRISNNMLTFLNDKDYFEAIMNIVSSTFIYLGQIVDINEVNIIDFCPFPVLGLAMLKRGIKSVVINPKNYEDDSFIKSVFAKHSVQLNKVRTLIANEWTLADVNHNKYHVIFMNIFNSNGEIDNFNSTMLRDIKDNCLAEGGLILPARISVLAQMASSEIIDRHSRAYDENVGFKVASHLNKYQLTEAVGLDLEVLNYMSLSSAVTIVSNIYNMTKNSYPITVTENGEIGVILCWYDVSLVEGIEEIDTYRSDSFHATLRQSTQDTYGITSLQS